VIWDLQSEIRVSPGCPQSHIDRSVLYHCECDPFKGKAPGWNESRPPAYRPGDSSSTVFCTGPPRRAAPSTKAAAAHPIRGGQPRPYHKILRTISGSRRQRIEAASPTLAHPPETDDHTGQRTAGPTGFPGWPWPRPDEPRRPGSPGGHRSGSWSGTERRPRVGSPAYCPGTVTLAWLGGGGGAAPGYPGGGTGWSGPPCCVPSGVFFSVASPISAPAAAPHSALSSCSAYSLTA
jgi:hypothetical protein